MRFLVRMKAVGVPRENLLEATRTIARNLGVDPRNPKWTSYGALEIDVFSQTKADFDLFLSALGPIADPEFVRDLNSAPGFKPEDELFSEARVLFNAERYWECHEVLEGIWRTKQGEEKRLLQGIILVCAAFVHHQKGEDDVALGVLKRAVKQLEYSAPRYGDFDVRRLRENVGKALRSGELENFGV